MYLNVIIELLTFTSSCWFHWTYSCYQRVFLNILDFKKTWDFVSRFLYLYISDCFRFLHLNFIITLPNLFIWWQACKFATTLIPVSNNTLQTLSSKTYSCISAGTGFNEIVFFLRYWAFVTTLLSKWMMLVIRWELKLLCCF